MLGLSFATSGGITGGVASYHISRADFVQNDSDIDGIPDTEDAGPGGDDNIDSDRDGVPDFCDQCPPAANNDADDDGVCGNVVDAVDQYLNSPPGTLVNSVGCSLAQLCPCETSWKNHGAYGPVLRMISVTPVLLVTLSKATSSR